MRITPLILILLIFCAFSCSDSPPPEETPAPVKDPGNAALHYLKALDLMQVPKGFDWEKENPDADDILKGNKACIEEYDKGILLEQCDFDINGKHRYLFEKKEAPHRRIADLTRLILLKGRSLEKKAARADAVAAYLSLLTLSRHVSLEKSLASKSLALWIEGKAYADLRNCLTPAAGSKELCGKILSGLKSHEKKHFPAERIIEDEREIYLSSLRMLSDGVTAGDEFTEEEKNKIEAFRHEFRDQGERLSERIHGMLEKAATTNKEEDWITVSAEIEKLKETVLAGEGRMSLEELNDIARNRPAEIDEEVAVRFAELTFIMSLIDFGKPVTDCHSALDELRKLISLAEEGAM